MTKSGLYHVGCLFFAFFQGLLWLIYIVFAIALAQDGVSDIPTQIFIHIVASHIIVGGSFLDILIRKIDKGTIVERILLSIVVSPFRLIAEIVTIVQFNTTLHIELFERGLEDDYSFLDRFVYILCNRSRNYY